MPLLFLKPKFVMMPIRAALTGQTHGADLGICIMLLGKESVMYRISKVLNTKLQGNIL